MASKVQGGIVVSDPALALGSAANAKSIRGGFAACLECACKRARAGMQAGGRFARMHAACA